MKDTEELLKNTDLSVLNLQSRITCFGTQK